MAIHAPITGTPVRAPFNPAPPAAVTRVLTRFDRADLASFIAVAIDLLDVADGDSDTEDNGDELDGNPAEDDFWQHASSDMPGCPTADPDKAVDDDGEQVNEDGMEAPMFAKPRYGIDQSAGPINEREATIAYNRSLYA